MGGSEVPTPEEAVESLQRDVFELQRTLARIEARLGSVDDKLAAVQDLNQKVDGLRAKSDKIHGDLGTLTSMTARSSSGQTLINLVALIHEKVRTL